MSRWNPQKLYESTVCIRCGKTFPWSPEYFLKITHKGYPLGCRQPCRACGKIMDKKQYKAHKEHRSAMKKISYQIHREDHIIVSRKWRKDHKEQHSAMLKEWRRKNPIKSRLYTHDRRAKIKETGGFCTKTDIERQLEGQKGRCWWCRKILRGKYEIDHRVPIAKRGPHLPANIVISCVTCNKAKHDKLPQDWIGRLF